MDPVQTSISGLLLAALGVLATIVKMLYAKVEGLVLAEQECRKEVSNKNSAIAALRSEMVSFGALLEHERADGIRSTGSLEAMIVVNAKTRKIKEWNVAASILFGYDHREVIRQSISMLIPVDASEESNNVWDNVYVTDRAPNRGPFKVRVFTKSGMPRPMEMTLSAYQDDQETLVSIILRGRETDSDLKTEKEAIK